jgi:hypothetical protein
MRKPCAVPRGHVARGYCLKHYEKWRKYGDPLAGYECDPLAGWKRQEIAPGVSRCPKDSDNAATIRSWVAA